MENTQNTTATTVAYKDATPEEQAARRAAQEKRDLAFLASRGLSKNASIDRGYLSAAVIKDDHMVAKNGKIGHRYFFALYNADGNNGKGETKKFGFITFSPKMMKLFDGIVDYKTQAKKDHNTSIVATIFSGVNANGYRDVAWANLSVNHKQIKFDLN